MKRIFALVFLMVLCSLSLHAAQNTLKVTLAAPTKVGNATLPVGEVKKQLRRGEASKSVARALEQSGLEPDRLTIEVTEHAVGDEAAAGAVWA